LVLVDSSVLVDFLRGRETDATRRLEAIERQEESIGWALPVVCLQEILQGARNEREWRSLHASLTSQELVTPLDPVGTHLEAARIFYDCRRRGLTVRSSVVCLIAALALERNLPLLHDDADFDAIAKVRPLRTIRG